MKKNWTLGIIIIIALFIVACSSKTDSTDESKKSSEKEGYSVASDSSPSPTPFTPEVTVVEPEPEKPKAWTDRIAEAAKQAAEDALERELSIGSSSAVCDFPEYDAEAIAAQYLKLFEEVIRQNG